MNDFEVVWLSDIHLNSSLLSPELFIEFLKEIKTNKLVITGDLFDHLISLFRLPKSHWKVLTQIRKLSGYTSIYWVEGNHDLSGFKGEENIECIAALLGLNIVKDYSLELGNIRTYALHGHQFDVFIEGHPFLTHVLTWIYDRGKEIDVKFMKKVLKFIKNNSKILLKNADRIREGCFSLAARKNYSLIVAGHVHVSALEKRDNIIYANCGSIEGNEPTFIGLKSNHIGLYLIKEDGSYELLKEIEIG